MSAVVLPITTETLRLAALLERLDPQPSTCTVPGCLHIHGTGIANAPLQAAA